MLQGLIPNDNGKKIVFDGFISLAFWLLFNAWEIFGFQKVTL
jgi:hypothetical protein